MTRESKVSLPIVTSDDGTRCGVTCAGLTPSYGVCVWFRTAGYPTNVRKARALACILADDSASESMDAIRDAAMALAECGGRP